MPRRKRRNAYGEPSFTRGGKIWTVQGGGFYKTKAEAKQYGKLYAIERGFDDYYVYPVKAGSGVRVGQVEYFQVAKKNPLYIPKVGKWIGAKAIRFIGRGKVQIKR